MKSFPPVLQKSCDLAKDHNKLGNKSPADLIRVCGYLEEGKKVKVKSIRKYFLENPDSANQWWVYSLNKRTDKGWYITTQDRKRQVKVGYYHPDPRKCEEKTYKDFMTAIPHYVKHELESMAVSANKAMERNFE